jgi:hypothetical protein
MIDQFGMAGIPNYDPTTNADSVLVCQVPLNPWELIAIYGIRGQGVTEANAVCSYMSDEGNEVDWS